MFAFFSRILGTIVIGVCLSSFGMILMSLLLSLRNLPRLLASLQNGLRRFLRLSFEVYALLIKRVRIWVLYYTGLDLLTPFPRCATTIALSLLIGWGISFVLGFALAGWMLVLLVLHGLFVGLAWEQITTPDDFQLGARVE